MKNFCSLIYNNSLIFLFFYLIYAIGYKVAFKLGDFLVYLFAYNFFTLCYLGILQIFKNGEILKCFTPKKSFNELLNECKETECYYSFHVKKRKIFDLFCYLYRNLHLKGSSNCLFGDYRLYLSDIKNIEEENDEKIKGFTQLFDKSIEKILEEYPKDEEKGHQAPFLISVY